MKRVGLLTAVAVLGLSGTADARHLSLHRGRVAVKWYLAAEKYAGWAGGGKVLSCRRRAPKVVRCLFREYIDASGRFRVGVRGTATVHQLRGRGVLVADDQILVRYFFLV